MLIIPTFSESDSTISNHDSPESLGMPKSHASSLGSGVTDATTANVPLALASSLKEELKPGTTLPSLGSDAAVISGPAGHSESGKEEKPS